MLSPKGQFIRELIQIILLVRKNAGQHLTESNGPHGTVHNRFLAWPNMAAFHLESFPKIQELHSHRFLCLLRLRASIFDGKIDQHPILQIRLMHT
jgi:hypothetical protein